MNLNIAETWKENTKISVRLWILWENYEKFAKIAKKIVLDLIHYLLKGVRVDSKRYDGFCTNLDAFNTGQWF